MKKLFIINFKAIYGTTTRKARKAWKASDDGTKQAIIAFYA